MNNVLLPLALIATLASAASAGDWPNWRGPNHNGVSSETGWVSKWPDAGPKQLWKASVGTGFSSVTISRGRAYTMGNRDGTDTVYCFDAETGSNLWKYSYPCAVDPHYYEGGPSASPTIDENRVYTMSKEGDYYCFDAAAGKIIWSTNIAQEVGAAKPTWGFASSGLVQDDLLIIGIGGYGTAVDKVTGKVVWTSDKEPAGYATPVPCPFHGIPAVAILSAQMAYGVETKSGKQLWSYPAKSYQDINTADVIVSGDEIFVSAGYDMGASMARLTGATPEQIWKSRVMRNHVNSCVLVDGYLYGVDGQAGNAATLKCVEFATGNEKWSFKGLGSGALMVADHKIIMISDKGELVVAEASPESFTPISRAQVLGGKCWTVPTLANGRIYCRNARGDVVCLDVKGT